MTQSYLVPLGEAEDGAWGPVISGSNIYDLLGGGRHTLLGFLSRTGSWGMEGPATGWPGAGPAPSHRDSLVVTSSASLKGSSASGAGRSDKPEREGWPLASPGSE